MNELTRQSVKNIFDLAACAETPEFKFDTFEGQIKRSCDGIERNSFMIAACLYGVKKCFENYHQVTRGQTTYTDLYEYAEALFGFKKTSTKNAINIIETYFDENGTLKPRFFGFGYSQLVELLPFKAEIPETVTAETTVKAVRELKKAGQTSDQTDEPTPLEELSAAVSEQPYVKEGFVIVRNEGKAFRIVDVDSGEIGQFPDRKPIKEVLEGVDVKGVGYFNTFVLENGDYVAVATYGNPYYKKNGQTSDQIEEPQLVEIPEEDPEDAIVEEIDGNPDEISELETDDITFQTHSYDEEPGKEPQHEENTTNGLEYLLKNGQTSDQIDKIYDNAIKFIDKIIAGAKPTLHLFKNKKEREDFIKNYKPWGVWKELPELGLKFYRYEFANGAVIIVTECPEYHSWAKEKWVTTARHCLILDEDYELPNSYGSGCCRAYDLSGTAPTYIIDYMTKFAKEI